MHRRNRGFALVLVIWSLVIMLGLSAGFAMAVRHETRVAHDLVDMTRLDATAIAARNLALLALNRQDAEQRWRPDGETRTIQYDGMQIAVRVRSETGRIDLNRAPRQVIVGLIEQLAPERDPQALADAMIDWRDRDDRRSEYGAEQDDYRNAGRGYTPPNQPFRSIHELGQVLGFDAELARLMRPYVSVHSQRPRINAMSAEAVVLAAIPDVDLPTAEQFVFARAQAIRAGTPPPVDMLRGGRRFIEMRLDVRTLLMDIAVLPDDGLADPAPVSVNPLYLEQVVMGMGKAQRYTPLSREVLQPTDAEPWWRP